MAKLTSNKLTEGANWLWLEYTEEKSQKGSPDLDPRELVNASSTTAKPLKPTQQTVQRSNELKIVTMLKN